MRKDYWKLVDEIQPQVISILIARGYVEVIDKNGPYKWGNCKITKDGEKVTKIIEVNETFLLEYLKLWPAGYRSTKSLVKAKLARFLTEHDCSEEDIILATKKWLLDKRTPYHGKADFFFYKEISGGEESRCEEYIELIKEKPKNDYRKEVI